MPTRPLGATGLEVSPVGLGLAALGRPAYIDLGRDADSAPTAACRRWSAAATRSWTPPGPPASATWTRPAPTAAPRRSWPPGCDRGGSTRPRSPSAPNGLQLRRRLADGRRHPRGQGPLAGRPDPPGGGDPGPARRPPRPLPGPLGHPRQRRPRGPSRARRAGPPPRPGRGRRPVLQRPRPGRHHPPGPRDHRRRAGPLRLRPGHLEPPGALRRPRPRRRRRGRLGRDRQGGGRQRPPHPHGHGPATTALARIAARHRVGVDAVALAAVLANPWVSVVLSGAVTPAQLESNLAALQVDLDAAELEELATLAEPPERYWKERAALTWS